MNDNRKLRVGITQGDPNGIGYEVILKALEDNRILELCTPVVYGSAKIAAFYRKAMGLPQVQFAQIASAAECRPDQYNIVNVTPEDYRPEPGVSSPAAGAAAMAALNAAVNDLKEGNIDVLVTAPINKHNIHSEEFSFAGHTEYLEARLAPGADGDDAGSTEKGKALMVLCNDVTRVALVTIHVPLSKVAESVTRENVLDRVVAFDASLRRDFGVHRPRIAVLALNPHAGEEGLMGEEETQYIAPALEEARKKKISGYGPYAADGFFGHGQFDKFDGVLAMYHDQGLAPFKTLACEGGVNFTAGLPYVRTSPDHGTGYDIAGKGEAEADSMRQAIYTAIDIYRNRQRYDAAHANPLRRQYVEKNKSDNVVLDLSKSTDE
ncbi:MAG: 4-hydroxythreonine-4-phosphate dehydrogenase PdxA [Paramuribaculum sp.]|nr:4-hydroxythreonine-4-phosphate dehydrogenase PdxA [Paramuribaculum sp.]